MASPWDRSGRFVHKIRDGGSDRCGGPLSGKVDLQDIDLQETTMRFRIGLILGFLIGYVLGAKAGVQRYHQIRTWFDKLMGSEPAQQIQTEVRVAASKAGEVLESKAADGVSKVTNLVAGEENSPNGGTVRQAPRTP
jgi:hypothetical protein